MNDDVWREHGKVAMNSGGGGGIDGANAQFR